MEETISTRIKKLRLEIDLTQEDLASKLGLKGKSSIANYEAGKITPSDEIKIKMCEVFNCTLDYLMCKSDIRNYEDLKKKDIERLISQLKDKNMDITEEQINKLKEYLTQEPNKITYEYEEFLNSLDPDVKKFITEFDFQSSIARLNWAIQDKDKKEFYFAYHKEMAGLTPEEIDDALRFYKEMKNRVNKNNKKEDK